MDADETSSGSFQALADHLARVVKHVLQTGDRAGLDDAIDLLRQIIKNTPLDEPDRAGRLSNLSVALGLRYTESGQQADIDDCLAAAREAIATARPDDKDATMYRANLFGAEQNRWQRTRDPAALDELIEAGRAAVAAAPPGYAKLTSLQSALGTYLNIRYGQTGHEADLDDAIEAMRGALVQMAHDNDWGVFREPSSDYGSSPGPDGPGACLISMRQSTICEPARPRSTSAPQPQLTSPARSG